MDDMRDDDLRALLKRSLHDDAALERDLWPRMLRRLDERPAPSHWLDWLLLLAAGGWLAAFPQVIPTLLFHF